MIIKEHQEFMNGLMTLNKAAEHAYLSRATVAAMIDRDELNHVYIDKVRYVYRKEIKTLRRTRSRYA